jgi:hypothetical protein
MRPPAVSIQWLVPRVFLLLLSIIGWGLFLRMVVVNVAATVSLSGEAVSGLGIDTYAYWLAGSHLLDGAPLYEARALDELGAYFYAPPFAQAWMPLSLLPQVVVEWGWRILGLLSIRYMAGSWLVSGLWMLFPGTIVELTAGNVTFQVAALTVAGLRGRAEGIFPAALVKLSSVAVVPFLWLRRPAARRGLLVGSAITAVVVAVSVVADAGLWRDYLDTLRGQADLSFEGTSILHILPTPAADYLLRVAVAAVIVIASVRFDSPHLAYLAAFLATPTLWEQRLAVLSALLTLENDRWLRPYLWPWRRVGVPAEQAATPTLARSPAPSDRPTTP